MEHLIAVALLQRQGQPLLAPQAPLGAESDAYLDLFRLAPIAYLAVGAGGTILAANEQAAALFGLTAASLFGRRLDAFVSQGDRLRFVEHLERGAGQRSPPLEVELTQVSGSTVPVRLFTALANDQHLVAIVDRREAEHVELDRCQAERVAQLLEGLPIPAFVIDAEWNLVVVNQAGARLAHCSRADLLGRHVEPLLPDLGPEALARAHAVRQSGRPDRLVATLAHAGGAALQYELHLQRVEAGLCVLAVDVSERARLDAQREAFVHELVCAQDEQTRRIARELHDGLGQTLASLELGLARLDAEIPEAQRQSLVQTLSGSLRDAIGELRRVSRGLHPAMLDDLGLAPALERLVQETRELTGLPIRLRVSLATRLPRACALAAYRVVQEALGNAVRHAAPRSVSIEVVLEEELQIAIRDDGAGFSPEARSVAGFGLRSMRERVESQGGSLHIASNLGRGTQVTALIPAPGGCTP